MVGQDGEACQVSVLVRTVLRPTLLAAVRSVFAQTFSGPVQILLGVDAKDDATGMIPQLQGECPKGMGIDVIDLGYATARVRGGLYPNRYGGVLPVVLAYAAKARHAVFLDDDNWVAPDHLAALRRAVDGFDWAYCLRWYVDADGTQPLCLDRWESVGPGKGVFSGKGGFVDLNCLMFDRQACHFAVPWLGLAMAADGTGEDRLFFNHLSAYHSVGWTGKPGVYYRIGAEDKLAIHRSGWLAEEGLIWP